MKRRETAQNALVNAGQMMTTYEEPDDETTALSQPEPLDDTALGTMELGKAIGAILAFQDNQMFGRYRQAQILTRIKENELFKPVYSSFKEFCSKALSLSYTTAREMISDYASQGEAMVVLDEIGIPVKKRQALARANAINNDTNTIDIDGHSYPLKKEYADDIKAAISRLQRKAGKQARFEGTYEGYYKQAYHSLADLKSKLSLLKMAAEVEQKMPLFMQFIGSISEDLEKNFQFLTGTIDANGNIVE